MRSPDALPHDGKTALKELCDKFHAAPHYSTLRLPAAPASEPLAWSCTLHLPALVRPGSREVALGAAQFQALGRGKEDAERHAAAAALAYAAREGARPRPAD